VWRELAPIYWQKEEMEFAVKERTGRDFETYKRHILLY